MVEPLVIIGGAAAGLYALISSKKRDPFPPPVEPLVNATIPAVKDQIAQGIPPKLALYAAVNAVSDRQLSDIVTANSCVLIRDPAKSTKTNPSGYLVSNSVIDALKKQHGWLQHDVWPTTIALYTSKAFGGLASAVPLPPSFWAAAIAGMAKIYLCPPGKIPPKS